MAATKIDIAAPLFSGSELCQVAMIERKLLNLWLEREVLKPTRIETLAVRKRPWFSVIDIFKVRLIKVLSESVLLSTTGAKELGRRAEQVSSESDSIHLAEGLVDEGWMYGAARAADRGKPIGFVATATRTGDDWELFLETNLGKPKHIFPPDVPFIVIPIEQIFAGVYSKCVAIQFPETSRRHGRS